MVKLRGVNVFPEAIAGVVASERRSNGEHVCIVERMGVEQREEITVLVEVMHAAVDCVQLQADLERRFKEVLGVRLIVEVVERGKTDAYTGTSRTSKIQRLLDRRVSA
jgi:phenylacetate-CoA ligase